MYVCGTEQEGASLLPPLEDCLKHMLWCTADSADVLLEGEAATTESRQRTGF